MHTLPPACLPVYWPGYSAQQSLPPDCLPACWPGCSAQATMPRLLHTLPPACLPACCLGYSPQATTHPATCLLGAKATLPRLLKHPATCLPACLLARLLFRGYCFTLPTACLRVCWLGYSAQQTLPPDCLPACLLARLFLPRLLCQGYCTPCHLPACLFAGQATLPGLLHTLPPAC